MGKARKRAAPEPAPCRVSLVPYLYRKVNGNWTWRPRRRGDKVKREELVDVRAKMVGASANCTAKIKIDVQGHIPRGTLRISKAPPRVKESVCVKEQRRRFWCNSWLNGGQPHADVSFVATAECKGCTGGCSGSGQDHGRVKFVNLPR